MNYGRYQIVKELGRGSMGVVYRAYDPQFDRSIALKVMRQDRVTSDAYVRRFLKEARAIGRLSHHNIVTAYDAGEDQGSIYIAMELVEGRPLNEIIKERKFSFDEIVQLGIQVAETLDYAHQKGVVHRDIKPSNIIVQQEDVVKITDFGIAHIEDVSATLQTQDGEVLGTPAYMSPEQVMGKTVDGRSDLFSLGIILYELATSERPFGRQSKNIATVFNEIVNNNPPSPSDANPHVEPGLSRVIMKCLDKIPERRYQTGKEMAEALRDCIKERDTLTQVISVAEPLIEKRPRKHSIGLPLLVLSFFAAVGILAAVAYRTEILTLFGGKMAVIQMQSNPQGAEIQVNGATKGKTPAELELPIGKHTLRVSLPGYEVWEDQIQLNEAKGYPLRVDLIPLPATAALHLDSSPPGAEVFLNGSFRGNTPLKADVAFGKHTVRLSLPGYRDWEEGIQLEEAKEYPLQVQLEPIIDLAYLWLESIPSGAEIHIDGSVQGKTPMGFELPLGKHNIGMRLPDYENWEDQVQLEQAREYPVKVKLKSIPKMASLNVQSNPSGAEVSVDGTSKGRTPAIVELTQGEHSITVSLQGYEEWQNQIRMDEAREYPLQVELKPVPRLASLKIMSTPSGAEVSVDGASKGKTPVQLMLQHGEHSIGISLDDYQKWEERIQLEGEKALSVNLKPIVREASLDVASAPLGAHVYIDGKPKGKTPLSLKMRPGAYMIVLRLPEYRDWKKKVRMSDKDYTIKAELMPVPKEAYLNAVSRPIGARVYVDGKARGRTPVRLSLSPGNHRVRFTLQDYEDSESQVDLKESEERSLDVTMTKRVRSGDYQWDIKPPIDIRTEQ